LRDLQQTINTHSRTLTLVLVAILLLTYGGQVWRLWHDVLRKPAPEKVQAGSQNADDYSIGPITSRQLFGASAALNRRISSQVQEPTTHSQLTLQAIFASPDGEAGSAIISGPDFAARSFSVNSQINDSISVARIEAKRVILNNNGRLESLEFPVFTSNKLSFDSSSNDNPGGRVSSNEFEQLLSVLDENERTRLLNDVETGDISSLMQALPEDQKLLVVRKRMEQLRQASAATAE
jgi:type II secretory pathway component PulC